MTTMKQKQKKILAECENLKSKYQLTIPNLTVAVVKLIITQTYSLRNHLSFFTYVNKFCRSFLIALVVIW